MSGWSSCEAEDVERPRRKRDFGRRPPEEVFRWELLLSGERFEEEEDGLMRKKLRSFEAICEGVPFGELPKRNVDEGETVGVVIVILRSCECGLLEPEEPKSWVIAFLLPRWLDSAPRRRRAVERGRRFVVVQQLFGQTATVVGFGRDGWWELIILSCGAAKSVLFGGISGVRPLDARWAKVSQCLRLMAVMGSVLLGRVGGM